MNTRECSNLNLAIDIIEAVRHDKWDEMLKLFPEGVEHRTYTYNEVWTFNDWDEYEDYAKYVAPAREMMKEKCLDMALGLLKKI